MPGAISLPGAFAAPPRFDSRQLHSISWCGEPAPGPDCLERDRRRLGTPDTGRLSSGRESHRRRPRGTPRFVRARLLGERVRPTFGRRPEGRVSPGGPRTACDCGVYDRPGRRRRRRLAAGARGPSPSRPHGAGGSLRVLASDLFVVPGRGSSRDGMDRSRSAAARGWRGRGCRARLAPYAHGVAYGLRG
jgi:hypothetical protein